MFAPMHTQTVESASTPLPSHPLSSSNPTLSDIIRTFLESDLDELPTRCSIAESCGLVSILSGIVSSHSSVGLRSIASNLLALIQNALGSCEVQTKEHCHLKSHAQSTKPKPIRDVNEQFDRLHNTMCTMATQMTEQFGKINSWMMKYDSLLNQLNEKQQFKTLQQYRFQRWSKTGADAVEIFDEDFFIKTGNTFTLRQRPENEETNFIPKTLFSPLISSDVAQLSFTITHSSGGYRYGVVVPYLVDTGTNHNFRKEKPRKATWGINYTPPANIPVNGAPPRRYTRQAVLEADCRVGRRTIKLYHDGKMDDAFSENIPLPFRFAINLHHPSVSVTIHSLTFTAKPTLKGGTKSTKLGIDQ
ncbi:hypothetical protein BLNAU_13255 [Blattamonas nauphoetae]|uniref:Uncharacterized protein n=1 Tax=Blattamonas nauphoetae TaxID=2049346 RepID=A0ABQ9XMB6_9EUKA|nr:hypothetical protein BLNAU_13255 [Blattamonas nauphoetae]